MHMHREDISDMTQPRRGRPPTGIRKERLQVMLDPDDHEMFVRAAVALGETQAELGRKVFKGEVTWAEVERAAKRAKGRK